MNTTFTFVVHCEKVRLVAAREVLHEAHRAVTQLEKELTEFLPESPVYQVNRAKSGEWVDASPALLELLDASETWKERTDGAFNHLAKSTGENPGLLREGKKIARETDGTTLGFGAIGKGFALDRVRAMLFQEGFTDFFLSAGGSSLVLEGFALPNEPWTWGWSFEDKDSGIPFSHETGKTIAIGVSGTAEQGHHILDSKSNRPAAKMKSALVGTESATAADALSTALFVLGTEQGFSKLGRFALGIIDNDNIPQWNAAFRSLWGDIPCRKSI